MSSRPELKAFPVITAASMGADVISPPSNINQITYVGYTVSWTGTPTGSFSVEVCNDAVYLPNGQYVAGTGTWVALTLSSSVSASGSAGSAFIDIDGVSAAFIRLHYTRSSGTGTLNATVAGKCS